MKVKWREHGLILFTLLLLISLTHDFLHTYNLSAQETSVHRLPFEKDHLSYNKYSNIFLPQAGAAMLLYVAYLWINFFTVRLFLANAKKNILSYLLVVMQFLCLSYLLALGINTIHYFARPYYFSYAGFRILAIGGYNDHPLKDLSMGFANNAILVAAYLVYVAIREYFIYKVEKPGPPKAYRILIINQISSFLIVFITIPVLSATFNLIDNDKVYSMYFVLLTPAVMVYIANTYWLFPTYNRSYFKFSLLIRLFATTFLFNLLVFFFRVLFHLGGSWNLLLGCWAVQLLVVTPITWLLYEQQKDKILQLRGAEQALTKSKADLQFLRSQINPHFLFNVLNTLYGTALREKAKDTATGIQKLGDMMRFMLRDNHLDFIPMNSEIAYLKNYISLQKLRIEATADITIEININEENCGHLIAPMLLIPFIENAFKHGINPLGKSWVKVNLSCDKQKIYFEVRNSVFPKIDNDPEEDYSGIGLQNVRERLNLFYAGNHELNCGIYNGEFVAELIIDTETKY